MPLSKPQETICESEARFRVAVTGRRFGKTYVAIRELSRAAAEPDKECLFLAPSYRMAKNLVWDQLKEKLKKLRWVDQTNEAELTIRLKSGSKIYLKGAESKDALRGMGYDFVALDEFQDMEPSVWTEVLRPTLSDRKGRALFTGTPRGVGSFSYDMYTMAQSTSDWASFKFTTAEGGNVTQDEIDQAKRDLDEKTFEQEYHATFNTYSGMVYYNFSRDETIQKIEMPHKPEIQCGIDFNLDPLSVCVAVVQNHNIYFVDEIVLKGSNTDEVCDELKRRYPTSKIVMYPDPAGKSKHTSSGGRSDHSILRNAGFGVNVRHAHTPVRDRVNAVNSKLKNAKGVRSMFIDPKCKQIIKSLERMTYKEGSSVINKDGENDHMADAVGYLVDFLYPVKPETNTQQPTRWAFGGTTSTGRSL